MFSDQKQFSSSGYYAWLKREPCERVKRRETLLNEIRKGGVATERDTVRVLNCPWLANNNTQPPADPNAWGIPGNLINSKAYPYANGGHGAQRVLMGDTGEFVQDSAEWGFQVRRQVPAADSRTMITAPTLHSRQPLSNSPLRTAAASMSSNDAIGAALLLSGKSCSSPRLVFCEQFGSNACIGRKFCLHGPPLHKSLLMDRHFSMEN